MQKSQGAKVHQNQANQSMREERSVSTINIRRAVENIRFASTTVYTPIVEMIVNAVQAIEQAEQQAGVVTLRMIRSGQPDVESDSEGSRIADVEITDNGIGFTEANRASWDTLYSELKIDRGGKGFGRLTCLRYFDDVLVDSIFLDGAEPTRRAFRLGKETELIIEEQISAAPDNTPGTKIVLRSEKLEKLPRKLSTIARGLVELLLPYFTTTGYECPRIELTEDGVEPIVLNDYVSSAGAIITEVTLPQPSFTLTGSNGTQRFLVRVFKFYSPQNKVSKLSLVAHQREVTESSLATYIPEFEDEFVDPPGADKERPRNFILKAYVFGDYLDENVLLERGAFSFHRDSDLLLGISQSQIERAAAEVAKSAVGNEVHTRREQKEARLREYVETQAPWYKAALKNVSLSRLSSTSTLRDMDALLHEEQFKQERQVRDEVAAVLSMDNPKELLERANSLVSKVSESSKNELVHYVALRRQVLELFQRSLEFTAEGSYETEDTVHNIIFPTRSDDLSISYEAHNLWILDERLTFTTYLASDLPLNGGTTQRPDILAFDRPIAFRSENEASNPVTIFEFKRPQRDNFVNASSKEDPIEQIVRYVVAIRNGEYKTPTGRNILVGATTPFYGYVVCDFTPKVTEWLHSIKNFKPMPDGAGYFGWRENINLYIEVLSWSKVLKDAATRNRAFFKKLGIDIPFDS